MKAMLVMTSFITRVIVPDDAIEHVIIREAEYKLRQNINDDFEQCIEEIIDDEECPYDKETDLLTSHY